MVADLFSTCLVHVTQSVQFQLPLKRLLCGYLEEVLHACHWQLTLSLDSGVNNTEMTHDMRKFHSVYNIILFCCGWLCLANVRLAYSKSRAVRLILFSVAYAAKSDVW